MGLWRFLTAITINGYILKIPGNLKKWRLHLIIWLLNCPNTGKVYWRIFSRLKNMSKGLSIVFMSLSWGWMNNGKYCSPTTKLYRCWIWNGKMWSGKLLPNWPWKMICCVVWSGNWWLLQIPANRLKFMQIIKKVIFRHNIFRYKQPNPGNSMYISGEMWFGWKTLRSLKNWILQRRLLFLRYRMSWKRLFRLYWWAWSYWKTGGSVIWTKNNGLWPWVFRKIAIVCWILQANCWRWHRWKPANCSWILRWPSR